MLTQVFYLSCLNFRQETNKVITIEVLGRIRRMYLRDKVSLHEMNKRTGMSRNTVRPSLPCAASASGPFTSSVGGTAKYRLRQAFFEPWTA